MAQAHAAGIVHRDIKPQNIFLTRTEGTKLLDFGISRLVERPTSDNASTIAAMAHTRQGVVIGTPGYMAPEQARGHSVDARTDIFACGCVLHEMLSGAAPFERSTPLDTLAALLSDPPPPLPPAPHGPMSSSAPSRAV